MAKTNINPKVRFARFSDDWEERKFEEDIILIQTGTNLLGNLSNKGMPLLKMGNIQRGYFSLKKIEFLNENEVLDQKNIAQYGDFLFNTRNTLELVGKGATWMGKNGEYAFNGNIARFTFKESVNTIFFNYLYNTNFLRRQVQARAMGTTSVAAIYPQSLNSIVYNLPSIKEQVQIGLFFQILDQLITEHCQKHEKLQALKKAMLSKMFPQEGQSVPEIRFKEFTGDWDKNGFDSIFLNVPNNSLSREKLNYDSGRAKNVHYGDILVKFNEVLDVQKEQLPFITDNAIVEKLKNNFLCDGDIIISDAAEDETVGKCVELVNVNGQNILSGLHTIAVRPKQKFAPRYFGYFLNSDPYHNQLIKLMQGTKVLSISKTAIKDTKVVFPKDYDEQLKIGDYFKKLDHLISNHSVQIEKLNNLKKAFLSKMFI